jgi:hypothetical protein
MHTSSLLSTILVAGTALAAPTSPIFRRQQDCGYYPDQANQATSTFILRIEALSNGLSNATTTNNTLTNSTLTNSTLPATNGTLANSTLSSNTTPNATASSNTILGYLDALSTSHGLLAPSKKFASQAFLAPTWNTNRVLLFWPAENSDAQEYERGFNLDPQALASPQSIAPIISTPGCGTPFVELVDRSSSSSSAQGGDDGECEFAGKKIRAQTGCPAFGTGSTGSQHCTEQKFFVCEKSGLQGIADSQGALFYGEAEQAQWGENCQEVELVSECV